MSDVMLYGILRMPYELAMNDEVSRFQFYENAQRAGDRIEELESLLEDCYKIQKMQAEEVYKGNAKIEELEKENAFIKNNLCTPLLGPMVHGYTPEGLIDPKSYYEGYEDGKAQTQQSKSVNWIYDNGKWSAKVDKKVFVESDDFTHDVRLYVDGDFEDDLQKLAYAKEIAKRLNAVPQTVWCDCGDAITKDSGAKCGVCARETK